MKLEMHEPTKKKRAWQLLQHAQGCTCQGSCGSACACRKNGKPFCDGSLHREATDEK